ncbi:hypothetical protein B0H19DRAFT_1276827 [Mycena capillaripes]|nr:hypothetical protein B0H19DRAFT_1276827 [Mycena capillaripes]
MSTTVTGRLPASRSPSPSLQPTTDDELQLQPLAKLGDAVDDEELNEDAPLEVTIDLPTLRPLGRIGNNTEVLARRSEAINLGAHAINKGFLHQGLKLSRSAAREEFPKQWELLNQTLRDLERLTLVSGAFVYRVRKTNYRVLLRAMDTMRRESEQSFLIEGKTPPALPQWGDRDDILDVYHPNDFEILGVCFRVEVENFLMLLNKYHDFKTHLPRDRDTEIAEAASRIYSSQGNTTMKPESPTAGELRDSRGGFDIYGVPRMVSTPPRIPRHWQSAYDESTHYPLTRDTSVGLANPVIPTGLPRSNRRISELLEPMEPLFERETSVRIPAMEPEEAEQMRHMNHQGEIGSHRAPRRASGGFASYTANPFGSTPPRQQQPSAGHPGGDPDDSDPDDGPARPPNRGPPGPPPRPPRNNTAPPVSSGAGVYGPIDNREPHFEFKLKAENVPKWDGNVDTIASYREAGHGRERPTQYFIRKTDLLNTVYTLSDSEIILHDVVEFQSAIRFHEESLMRLDAKGLGENAATAATLPRTDAALPRIDAALPSLTSNPVGGMFF